MINEEKLKTCVELAQSYILDFLKDYIGPERISEIVNMFKNTPVVLEGLESKNTFGRTQNAGGVARLDEIVINTPDIEYLNMENEYELNNVLGTIIHEYAHKIRAINNKYGRMFEEAFASIFAEVCVNRARLKSNDKINVEVFSMLESYDYRKAESQVCAVLYILEQYGLDLSSIVEYIAGDQGKFLQTCAKIFGDDFINYYNSVLDYSKDNQETEKNLIDIIVKYIDEKGLNIEYYHQKGHYLSERQLYIQRNPTLSLAIVKAGKENFSNQSENSYRCFEYAAKIEQENNSLPNQISIERIRQYISDHFTLENKSADEILDTVLDLCSMYIQQKNMGHKDSKIFISEITKTIPFIEDFTNKYAELRQNRIDYKIVEDINLDGITYFDLYSKMTELLKKSDEKIY